MPEPTITAPPTLTTQYYYKRDLETLPTLTDDNGNTYTTPSITVPPSSNNPFILRTSDPDGTVFIAVGAIVGAILLGFILYHLIKSIKASKMAKKAVYNDKQMYEKYQNNNNTAYGLTPSTTLTNFPMHNQSVGKLPLLSHHPSKSLTGLSGFANTTTGSQVGDTSTIYQASEVGAPTSKHDLTRMFISPTAEVMSHKRVTSTTNVFSGSQSDLSSPANRSSQFISNLYINQEGTNSDYSLSTNANSKAGSVPNPPAHLQQLQSNSTLNVKPNRRTIPSMYLEDLIDE